MTDKATFKKLRSVLEFVWNSPYSSFYRDKYKKAGINLLKDLNSMEDFKKLPYLTKDEIVKSDPYDRCFLPLDRLSTIQVSSGTTRGSDSLSVVFKARSSKIFKKNIREAKVKRIMFLVPATRAIQSSFINDRLKMIKVAGDITNLPLSAKIAAKLKIDSLRVSPTTLYFFIPHLKREYCLDKIKLISLFGEYCSRQKALLFKKSFRKASLRYNYGMSENDGSIGLYCRFLDSLFTHCFHPSPELYHESVDFDGAGELVITNLLKSMFPLIRYRTGDEVEIEDFSCKCGVTQRMKVLGRINYDAIKIHGAFIYASLLDKALSPFSSYFAQPEWQLHIFEDMVDEKIVPRLKLQLILKKEYYHNVENIRSLIEKGVSDNLYISAKKTLLDLVNDNVFSPLEVEFVESFPISVKHRYIISHLS